MSEKRTSDVQGALHDLELKLQEEKIRIEAGMELIEIYNGTGDLDKLRQSSASSADRTLPTWTSSTLPTGSIRTLPGIHVSLLMVAPDIFGTHQIMAHEMARQGDGSHQELPPSSHAYSATSWTAF